MASGNPYGHGDGGKPWVCTPLISRGTTPLREAAFTPRPRAR
jgi:hypothetical protein